MPKASKSTSGGKSVESLRHDEAKGRVVSNRPIRDPNVPVMSFGEDEKGEVYFLEETATGKGIHRFARPKEK